MKIIFVGFSVKKDKAVLYKKIEAGKGQMILGNLPKSQIHFLAKPLLMAYEKGCDFVSIRFVREEE